MNKMTGVLEIDTVPDMAQGPYTACQNRDKFSNETCRQNKDKYFNNPGL